MQAWLPVAIVPAADRAHEAPWKLLPPVRFPVPVVSGAFEVDKVEPPLKVSVPPEARKMFSGHVTVPETLLQNVRSCELAVAEPPDHTPLAAPTNTPTVYVPVTQNSDAAMDSGPQVDAALNATD